jgi:hypothetical protein
MVDKSVCARVQHAGRIGAMNPAAPSQPPKKETSSAAVGLKRGPAAAEAAQQKEWGKGLTQGSAAAQWGRPRASSSICIQESRKQQPSGRPRRAVTARTKKQTPACSPVLPCLCTDVVLVKILATKFLGP